MLLCRAPFDLEEESTSGLAAFVVAIGVRPEGEAAAAAGVGAGREPAAGVGVRPEAEAAVASVAGVLVLGERRGKNDF